MKRKREEKSRRIGNNCKLDGSGCSRGEYTWLNKFKARKFFFFLLNSQYF